MSENTPPMPLISLFSKTFGIWNWNFSCNFLKHKGTHEWSFVKIWDGHLATFLKIGSLEQEWPTHIIQLLTNYSLDCIFHNNCCQFSWGHKGDWNCRWIIGFIDRLALWPQFWGNRYRYVWCHNPLRTPHSRTMSVVSLIIPSRIMGVRNQCLKIRFAMGWEGHFLYAFQAVK